MDVEMKEPTEAKPKTTEEKSLRKPYRSPQLEDLGDVRSVTLGSTVFTEEESGIPGNEYIRI